MWEFHTGQRIAAFSRDTREVLLERTLSPSLPAPSPPSLAAYRCKRRVKAYPGVCARNKPLDNLCIPNGRYYLSSVAVNKIYKLDARRTYIYKLRARRINARADATPAKGVAKLRVGNFLLAIRIR